MKTTMKMGLFGGALIAAGIMTPAVQADFVHSGPTGYFANKIEDNVTSDVVYGPAYTLPADATATANFDNVSGTSRVFATGTEIGIDISLAAGTSGSDGWASATAYTSYGFTVATTTQVLVEWDFTQITDTGAYTYLVFPGSPPVPLPITGQGSLTFLDVTNSNTLLNVFDDVSVAPGTDGSMTFTLNPGVTYSVGTNISTGIGSGFARVTIVPTPGALALLGAAGVVGSRKRRRY